MKTEIFPRIENKKIKGYRKIQLLRRELEAETEFTTLMWFERLEAVIAFVGADYETVYVPESARKVLSRFDQNRFIAKCGRQGIMNFNQDKIKLYCIK